jgi:hypothetical protein
VYILNNYNRTSSLSKKSLYVSQTRKIKRKNVFTTISPNSEVNCFAIWRYGEEMIITQYIVGNSWFYKPQKQIYVFPSDIAFNYNVLESYGEAWKKIRERVSDLDEIFDEESNEEETREKYQSTKKLLLNVLSYLNPKIYPLIGIDDNGQIGAEWQDGPDYKILSIIPRHENNISVSYIKKNRRNVM